MRHEPSPEEDAAYDQFTMFVGKYVLAFQAIEGMIDQALLSFWGHENWTESQRRLASMTNERKIAALTNEFFSNPLNARGLTRPDWVARFEAIVVDLHSLRAERNSLLHSQYIYEFMKIGHPVLKADRRRGEQRFHYVEASAEWQNEQLGKLGELAMKVSFGLTQIRFDVGSVERATQQARDNSVETLESRATNAD